MWTFTPLIDRGEPVRQLGLNFGAPGDPRGPDETLWLDIPSVGGTSPDIPVEVFGDAVDYVRYHTSSVEEGDLPFVASSALRPRFRWLLRDEPCIEYSGPITSTERRSPGPT